MSATVDVLVPSFNRPIALAMTLTGLAYQTYSDFRVVVSDQTVEYDVESIASVSAAARFLKAHGKEATIFKHLPRRGMAEQRHFLLSQATASYVLFLDDDVILEPDVISNLVRALEEEGCGFVGNAVIGLSFINDVRPHEQHIEFWDGPVQPETIVPGGAGWERWKLHNAANIYHIQQRLNIGPERPAKYKVAWVGGCALYDTAKLLAVGGFNFWHQLPNEHAGEDVFVQLRLMARYGGCGLLPSGAYHMELPTTVVDRTIDAPRVLKAHADVEVR